MMKVKIMMKMKRMILLLLVCVMVGGLVSCGDVADPRGDGVLTVVATTFAGYDFARQILRDVPDGEVNLVLLGKSGQDMHDFEPTAADIATLSDADVLVCLGSMAERWLESTLKASMNENVIRVEMMAVCEIMEADHSHHEHDEGESCEADGALIGVDEHVWLSPKNACEIAKAIGEAICKADVAGAERHRAATDAYMAELTDLWSDYEAMVSSAVRDTVLIADRYPFAYLMRDLGLTCYAAFPGCSSETSASFATQIALIETTRERELPYIFKLDGSDGKVAESVAAETGAGILTLDSLQVVSDRSKTYVGVMRENLEQLRKALC